MEVVGHQNFCFTKKSTQRWDAEDTVKLKIGLGSWLFLFHVHVCGVSPNLSGWHWAVFSFSLLSLLLHFAPSLLWKQSSLKSPRELEAVSVCLWTVNVSSDWAAVKKKTSPPYNRFLPSSQRLLSVVLKSCCSLAGDPVYRTGKEELQSCCTFNS